VEDSQHSPGKILELARSFTQARILLTAAELDLFTLLAAEPLSAQELSDKTGFFLRPLIILLDALAAMGFIVKKGDRYRTEPALAPVLSADTPRSIRPMLLHSAGLWKTWSDLTAIVRDKGVTDRPAAIYRNEDELRAFIGAMHVVGSAQAEKMAAVLGPERVKVLLDVGGASGTYTLAFLKANPNLTAILFDQPPVVEMARERLGRAGVLDRVTLAAGDFHVDELPPGADLALLSAIIHQNSPEQNLDLYCKVFRALVPGGRIAIRDHIMEADRTRPRAGAVFAVNMLVATPGGGTYTFEEVRKALQTAGFTKIKLLQTGERMEDLVEGYKP